MKIQSYFVPLTYQQLLIYGVHVGHSFANSVLFSSWLVYTYTQNILIINLYKTLIMLKVGFVGIGSACISQSPIWFINLDKASGVYVRYAAKSCGEISWTGRWVNGFISNYASLNHLWVRLRFQAASSYKYRQRWAIENRRNWFFTRLSWPRATFVSSVFSSYFPVKESFYLGVPCVGITDTNSPGTYATMPVPGNDDSIICQVFYMTLWLIMFYYLNSIMFLVDS